MNIHSIYSLIGRPFRNRRSARFRGTFGPCSVLDFGGAGAHWVNLPGFVVTLINLDGDVPTHGFDLIRADACSAPFPDNAFDLSFSNSLIEHVGNWERQNELVSEMRRCGRMIYCQTPNFWFPIEPHLLMPFAHWIPGFCKSYFCIRYLTPLGLIAKPTKERVMSEYASINLLTKRQVIKLFPDCEIWEEKVLGLTKSFIAVDRGCAARRTSTGLTSP